MTSEENADDFERLHALISGTADLKAFLDGVTGFGSGVMTRVTGARVECAVTLRRSKRSATIAGSSDGAILLDGIEQDLGLGPCVEAHRTGATVLLGDVSSDRRWPEYSRSLGQAGYLSVLGVPMDLETDSVAVLNFFAPATGLFTADTIRDAELFADMAGRVLNLALRTVTADQLSGDLKSAMEGRTAIDVACGIIMAQNRCSQQEAMDFLLRASSTRNIKLHSLCQDIVAHVSGQKKAHTHFED
ncbi:GAF and ANTAR domain-containing protein [Arthrobacter sp. TMN-37]